MAVTRRPHAIIPPRLDNTQRNVTIVLLISTSVVFLLLGGGLLTYLLLHQPTTANKPRPHQVKPAVTPITITEAEQINTLGQQYMHALVLGDYHTVWSMLSPTTQASWPDIDAFSTYMKDRFATYTLQSFTLGHIVPKSFWVNPETMVRYDQVALLLTSLQMTPQLPADQLSKLAPQFQNPNPTFQNVPLVVQHIPGDSTDQWRLLNAGPADVEAPILPPIHPTHRVVKVPILMYHYISTVPTHDPDPMERKSLSVSPQVFGQQLDYLKAQNFHSITFNQLMANLYYNIILPPSPVILTFDDGYDDAYSAAYPILKAHGYSGMFYIISGKVGWKGQASWDQLREMLDNGMQMGSHTIHHVDMGSVYQASKLQAQQEVQISQQTLQQNLGIVIQHFCYPNGGPFKGNNRQLQQKVVSLLATNGYIDATTDPGPTGIIQDNLQPFVLLRLRIDGRSSMQFFEHTM